MLFMYRKTFCLQEFNTGPCPSCTVLLPSRLPSFTPLLCTACWKLKDSAAGSAEALWVQRGSYLVYSLRVQFMVTKEACPDLPAMTGNRKCTAWHIQRSDWVKGVSVFFHHSDIFTFSANKSAGLEKCFVRGYAQFGRELLVVRLLALINSFMSW